MHSVATQLDGAAPVFWIRYCWYFHTVFIERSACGAKRNWESEHRTVFVHDHGTAAFSALVHHVGRPVGQPLVRALAVVKDKVFRQAEQQLFHRGVSIDVHVFVLDAAPQPLDKNVIEHAPPSIHADGDTLAFEDAREALAGEL